MSRLKVRQPPKVLIGTKCDLIEERKVNEERVRQLAKEFDIAYFELSHACPDGFSAMREHII